MYTYGKGFVKGPVGIACETALTGDLFVASYKDNRVLRFSSDGHFLGVAAGGGPELPVDGVDDAAEAAAATATPRPRRSKSATINSPSGLAFAEDGTLWVASYTTGAVTRFNSSYSGGGGRSFWRVTD